MPTLSGKVSAAAPGLHGFDANSMLSQAQAAAFRKSGFQFCIRYLSRSTPQPTGDLSNQEAANILSGGLALMPVQHVARPGWIASAALGTDNGKAAATHAREIGFPPGVNVWLDLEGVHPGSGKEEVVAYCNAWFDEVGKSGYAGGVYVGAGCVLSGDELFWRLRTRHYWRSGSDVPEIEHRGYQLIQRINAMPDVVNGIAIDRDLTRNDALGGAVLWLEP